MSEHPSAAIIPSTIYTFKPRIFIKQYSWVDKKYPVSAGAILDEFFAYYNINLASIGCSLECGSIIAYRDIDKTLQKTICRIASDFEDYIVDLPEYKA